MNIIIRRAEHDDVNAIWDVRTKAIQTISEEYYSKHEIEIWVNNEKPPNFANVIVELDWLVAFLNDRIIGTGFIDTTKSEVGAIFVDPGFQRKGVGHKILKELEKIAKGKGLTTLYLDSTLSAVNFYEAEGYKQIAKGSCQLGSIKLASVKMDKNI